MEVLPCLTSARGEWQELWEQCPDATPFQSPAWLIPWWEQFGRGKPLTLAARRNGKLSGLGLFYSHQEDGGPGKQIFFVGKAVSDYLDVLVAPGQPRMEVTRQILERLLALGGSWKSAELDRLPPSSPLLQVGIKNGVSATTGQDGVCPEVQLRGQTVEQCLPAKTLRSLRSHSRRTRELGTVEFATAGARDCGSFMDDLLRLHSRRWNALGLPGVFSDDRMNLFLQAAAGELQRLGVLRLNAMRLNGVTIAVVFSMLHRRRSYFYLTGFDPSYSEVAPVSQLIAFTMRQAADEGAEVFDLLQGSELYKYHKWGAEPRYTWRVRLVPARVRAD